MILAFEVAVWQSGSAIPQQLPAEGHPLLHRRGQSGLDPQLQLLVWSSDGRTARSSRLAKETTCQRGPLPPVAIRHPPGMETVASHMVMGTCHSHFVFPHPMAVCLGNQHAIHPVAPRRDEVELRPAVAVPSGQGHS